MLNQFVSVYVPGTRDINRRLPVKEQRIIAERVATRLSNEFGGATATPEIGYYVSNTGELVKERILAVKSFHDHDSKAALIFAELIARDLKEELHQESVTVETNEGIEFV